MADVAEHYLLVKPQPKKTMISKLTMVKSYAALSPAKRKDATVKLYVIEISETEVLVISNMLRCLYLSKAKFEEVKEKLARRKFVESISYPEEVEFEELSSFVLDRLLGLKDYDWKILFLGHKGLKDWTHFTFVQAAS